MRQHDFSLIEAEVEMTAEMIRDKIQRGQYDFSKYTRNVFTQHSKKRIIYSFQKLSVEDILCQY